VTTKERVEEKIKRRKENHNPKSKGWRKNSGRWKGTFYKRNNITKQTKHRIGVIK